MGRLEVAVHSGAHLQFCEAMWGPVYEAVLNILGSTGTILPVGDPLHGQPNAATFKSVGEEQVTFTWSEPPNSFDKKLDLTDPASWQGIVPIVDFNGIDEQASTPDAAYWTRVEVASPFAPFSMGAWVRPDVLGAGFILSKYGAAGAREYNWALAATNKHRLTLRDDSASVSAQTDSTTVMVVSQWAFLVVTYTGDGGIDAADSIVMYTNGVVDTGTPANNAAYVAMENLAALVRLGSDDVSPIGNLYDGQMAGGPLGPFFTQKVLTLDEVKRLYNTGRRALALR